MKTIKAKVRATGEEIYAMETESNVFYCPENGVNYRLDELCDIDESPFASNPPIPERKEFDTTSMFAKILDNQMNSFWRDQRVEIVKILLAHGTSLYEVVQMADMIIRQLKEIED